MNSHELLQSNNWLHLIVLCNIILLCVYVCVW